MPARAARASEPAIDPALLPHWLVLGSLTFPGRPEHVRRARKFVARTIGDECPRADAALLLTSELVTNAVVHSRSRLAGGTVTVVVADSRKGLLVIVSDNGSDGGAPALSYCPVADNGNGLLLVQSLADGWGYVQDDKSTTVWFRLSSPRGLRGQPSQRAYGLPAARNEGPSPPQAGQRDGLVARRHR